MNKVLEEEWQRWLPNGTGCNKSAGTRADELKCGTGCNKSAEKRADELKCGTG